LAIAAALLPFALDWRSPSLAAIRPWALACLIAVPFVLVVAGIAALRRPRAPSALRLLDALALTLAALTLASTLALEARFRWTRQQVLNADPGELEKLGRHLIVGYGDLDEIHALIARRAVAGVYLAARNVRGLSAADVKRLIDAMQDIRRGQNLPPLWIATDQEGGDVSRLSPPLARPALLADIVGRQADRAQRLTAIRQFAREQGRELAGLGVNLNLAPVIDLDHGLVNPDDRLTASINAQSRATRGSSPRWRALIATACGKPACAARSSIFPASGAYSRTRIAAAPASTSRQANSSAPTGCRFAPS
jgi:beta-N-acetylhexosaminidase